MCNIVKAQRTNVLPEVTISQCLSDGDAAEVARRRKGRGTYRPCIPDQMFTTDNNGAGVSLINSLRSLRSHGRLSSDISSDKPVFLASVTGRVPCIYYSRLR